MAIGQRRAPLVGEGTLLEGEGRRARGLEAGTLLPQKGKTQEAEGEEGVVEE